MARERKIDVLLAGVNGGHKKMKKMRSIFYFHAGRLARGKKIKTVGSIFWSGKWPAEDPFKRDEFGRHLWAVKGYRRVNWNKEMPWPLSDDVDLMKNGEED